VYDRGFVSADHRQHCLTAVFISDVRTSLKRNTETVLGLFQPVYSRVEKYANEAETVSMFYFSFISRCESRCPSVSYTGYTQTNKQVGC